MRKLLIAMAKAEMKKKGIAKVNRCMSGGRWRDFIGAYPGFLGSKKQKKARRSGPSQPILTYPAPKGRYTGRA